MKLEVGEHNVVLTPQLAHDPILNSVTQDLVLQGRNLDSSVEPMNLQIPQQQHRSYMASLSSLSSHLDPMMSRVSSGVLASHHSLMQQNGNHISASPDSGGSVLTEGQMETLVEDTVTWGMSSPTNTANARTKMEREKETPTTWGVAAAAPNNEVIARAKGEREKP